MRIRRALAALVSLFLVSCASNGVSAPSGTPSTVVELLPKRPPVPSSAAAAVPAPADVNEYEITARIDDPDNRIISGAVRVDYRNRSDISLSSVFFNLRANGLRRGSAVRPYFDDQAPKVFGIGALGDWDLSALPDGRFGYIVVETVTRASEELRYTVSGTVMEVVLPEALSPGESVQITMKFTARPPLANTRVGSDGSSMWFASVFPVAAVFDGAWRTEPVYPKSGSYFSDAANYNVRIKVPDGVTVVGAGQASETADYGEREAVFRARMVRDFPFAVLRGYVRTDGQSDSGVQVSAYTRAGAGTDAADLVRAASESVDYMSETIAPFPLQSLGVVEVGLDGATAEAFSGLVFVDRDLAASGDYDYQIARAVAACWFGGGVGFDPARDPWLGEGIRGALAELLTHESESWPRGWRESLSERLVQARGSLRDPLSSYRASQDFEDGCETKSMLMMIALEEKLGAEAFRGVLREMYESSYTRFADADVFIEIASNAAKRRGVIASEFFEEWLDQPGLPDGYPGQTNTSKGGN
ncbi:MAG: hypothetical protein LBK41_05125 [Clostridiales bacterium]|jgi:hypothetical protein|nr:hypothetical protein [Clostridiales bacterium]